MFSQNKLGGSAFTYVAPGEPQFQNRVADLWNRVRACAMDKITRKCVLPPYYYMIN